ncbi:calmodulin-like protein 6 isoform X4 [Balaenoptera musculus]|uniref:Calmodulin-like protein 6 isoform X4 n=1 Tax=Balaenoptera musculus TaxID=9771 RepID=A0A8B8VVI7_BALMU|nr:calmodulin-like protein 6 isoform X4 [Balaenoptera musculus]
MASPAPWSCLLRLLLPLARGQLSSPGTVDPQPLLCRVARGGSHCICLLNLSLEGVCKVLAPCWALGPWGCEGDTWPWRAVNKSPHQAQLQRHRAVSPQLATDMTERLTAEQIKEYEGVFEMFDEEGNGAVKTDELERLVSLLGINPTKSELASMAKDVDREKKGFFNCEGFLALRGVYWEKAQNQESELRAASRIFDKEGKGYIDWGALKYVLARAGEPLSEVEAAQMMKEADKDGGGTIDYEGEWGMGLGARRPGRARLLTCPSALRVRGHDDWGVLQAGPVGAATAAVGSPLPAAITLLPTLPSAPCQLRGQ